ncbi:DUF1904 family protein [Cohnella massiliensis]|uniref:DUF1904 family protein n=1 Tax=Cohnella massiliensis TaxID=1816691 RepID=UPI0009BBB1F9|nr:DUF1904 family protein [Cohnella massiliensis]
MPQLLIRGIGPERVRAASRSLIAELAAVCECPPDHIMLECLPTAAFFDGEEVPVFPFVEVAWFDRGEDVRDRFAEAVDRHFRAAGIPELEIAFRTYRPEEYYINGKRAGGSRENPAERAGRESEEERESALRAAEAENRRLKEELAKTRKSLQSAAGERMSSRLRDALRE